MKLTAESTVIDDKKIGESFSSLQVDADGIRTEVSRKVGNDEIISRINQTPETIQIDASKVEITGTAVFNAVNSNSSTKAAMLNSELEIGGRNLVPQSKNMKSFTVESSSLTSVTYTDTSCTLINNSSNTSTYGIYYDLDVESGADYVLSATFSSISGTAKWAIGDQTAGTSRNYWTGVSGYTGITNGINTKAFTTPSDCNKIRIYIGTTNNGSRFTISNLKLEKGNKATDWTPAPEDVQSEIDAARTTATTYITKIDDAGIFVSPSNQNPTSSAAGNSVKINGEGLYVYQGGTERAYFRADAAAIGTNGGNRSIVNNSGLHVYQLINNTQTEVANFGSTARVGLTTSYNAYIDSNGIQLRSASTTAGRFIQGAAVSRTRVAQFGSGKQLSSGSSYTHAALSSATGTIYVSINQILTNGTKRHTFATFTKGSSTTTIRGLTYNGSTMFTNGSSSGYSRIDILQIRYTVSEVGAQLIIGDTTSYGNNALTIGKSGSDPLFTIDSGGNMNVAGNLSAWNIGNTNISGTTGLKFTGVSCPHNTWTDFDNFVLAPGVWALSWLLSFSGNSTGIRAGNIAQGQKSAWTYVNMNAVPSGFRSVISTTQIVAPTAADGTTYYINGYQNSGSSLTVDGEVFMVQIS